MSEELKECPFCGDSEHSIMEMKSFHTDGITKWQRVRCGTCGAMAPKTVWNQRAALKPVTSGGSHDR